MLLQRDPRFEAIKPMLNEGKITRFADIFLYMKITRVARALGKRTTRFRELISQVGDLYIKELMMMARLFDLTPEEMLGLVGRQLAEAARPAGAGLFPAIPSLVNDGKIEALQDIIPYIEISKLAASMGRSSTRMKELMENVEDLQVRKLQLLADLCCLTLDQILRLVASQLDRKTSRVKVKGT